METAIECKVARLPRQHQNGPAGARYDIGPLVADYLRLRDATELRAGYIIIFVYGPLVADAQSDGKLYRLFHNQMAVDLQIAREHEEEYFNPILTEAYEELGWDQVYASGTPPRGFKATKIESLVHSGGNIDPFWVTA